MARYQITGPTTLPDDKTPIEGTWSLYLGTVEGTAVGSGGGVRTGTYEADTDPTTGLAAAEVPESGPDDAYVATFKAKHGRLELGPFGPFKVTGPMTWAEVINVPVLEDVTPTQAARAEAAALDAEEARQAAVDAAAAVPNLTTLGATFVSGRGANVPRALGRLRSGQALKVGILGDSKLAPGTAGNIAGDAVTKALALVDVWSASAITITNAAESGHTAFRQTLEGDVATIAAAVPDVVFLELGTNDSNSDANGTYAAGYPLLASMAAIERACAYIRDSNESCEFVFLATTPYTYGSAANAKIQDYNAALKSLAAVIGAEYVDLYAAFVAYGNWTTPTTLLLDSTHRNAAGNDLAAAAIAAHFPQAGLPVAPALAPRAVKGKYDITRVDKTKGALGYIQFPAAGTSADGSYVLTGTWTQEDSLGGVGTTYDVTTEVGAKFELTATKALELFALVDLGSAALGGAYPVVDVYRDDVKVADDVALHTLSSKNDANYWVPFLTGQDGAGHKLGIVLQSGKLRIGSAAILAASAGSFTPETRLVTLDGPVGGVAQTAVPVPTDGSYITVPLIDKVITKPSTWGAMDAIVVGFIIVRVAGTTTTVREVQYRIRHASTAVLSPLWDSKSAVPTGENAYSGSLGFQTKLDGVTGNTQYRLDARLLSTDKTNTTVVGWGAYAILTRTA